MRHMHRVKKRGTEYGWVTCVSGSRGAVDHYRLGLAQRADGVNCHAAHGGVVFMEFCHCGAFRLVEVNGRHRAETPWMFPETRR